MSTNQSAILIFFFETTVPVKTGMQGPFGSTEAVNRNGTEISPLTTWDSKITRYALLCSLTLQNIYSCIFMNLRGYSEIFYSSNYELFCTIFFNVS